MGTKLSGICSVFGTTSYSGLAELASRKRSTISSVANRNVGAQSELVGGVNGFV